MLRKELKPKELRVVPNELTFNGEQAISEYTLLHNCMKEWRGLSGCTGIMQSLSVLILVSALYLKRPYVPLPGKGPILIRIS